MRLRAQFRCVPAGLALAVIAVAVAVLLVKAAGLLGLLVVVLVDRLLAAGIAGADWIDERMSARAGMAPLSRLGFTMGGARR